jgi:hypothetical protein
MPDYSEYQPMTKKKVDINNLNDNVKKANPLESNIFGLQEARSP